MCRNSLYRTCFRLMIGRQNFASTMEKYKGRRKGLGRGAVACNRFAPQKSKFTKHRFCRRDNVRHFTWFSPSAYISHYNRLMISNLEFWKILHTHLHTTFAYTQEVPTRFTTHCPTKKTLRVISTFSRSLQSNTTNAVIRSLFVKWNTNLMQHCAGFISAESLYMFRAQAPIIRSI